MLDNQKVPATPDTTASDCNDKQTKVGKWISIISVVLQAVAGIFSRKN